VKHKTDGGAHEGKAVTYKNCTLLAVQLHSFTRFALPAETISPLHCVCFVVCKLAVAISTMGRTSTTKTIQLRRRVSALLLLLGVLGLGCSRTAASLSSSATVESTAYRKLRQLDDPLSNGVSASTTEEGKR